MKIMIIDENDFSKLDKKPNYTNITNSEIMKLDLLVVSMKSGKYRIIKNRISDKMDIISKYEFYELLEEYSKKQIKIDSYSISKEFCKATVKAMNEMYSGG